MPIDVADQASYLSAVVTQFRREAGQLTGFELRKRLWHSAVVVCEVTQTGYQDWHLTLAEIAYKAGLGEREVIATILSAKRKTGVQ